MGMKRQNNIPAAEPRHGEKCRAVPRNLLSTSIGKAARAHTRDVHNGNRGTTRHSRRWVLIKPPAMSRLSAMLLRWRASRPTISPPICEHPGQLALLFHNNSPVAAVLLADGKRMGRTTIARLNRKPQDSPLLPPWSHSTHNAHRATGSVPAACRHAFRRGIERLALPGSRGRLEDRGRTGVAPTWPFAARLRLSRPRSRRASERSCCVAHNQGAESHDL